MIHIPFKIFNKKNEPIRGDAFIPLPDKRFPVIIMCHDFMESKDRGFLPYLAEILCKRDFIVIRFNVSGSGYGENSDVITEPGKFENNSYSQELDDLDILMNELENGKVCGKAPYFDRIGVWGQGRGGGIAILKAASDRRIQSLVTWSAYSHIIRQMFKDALPQWKRQGFFQLPESLAGLPLQLNEPTLNDIEKHSDSRLDILKSAGKLSVPYLIVHAGNDDSVPVKEGNDLYKSSNQNRTQYEKITGADHFMNTRHPFAGPNPVFKNAFKVTLQWFKATLN